jgi:dodecin
MAVVKVIELLAESEVSWEKATQEAITEAAKTVRNIKTVYVESMQAIVQDNKIVQYRVNAKVSFVIGDQ